MFAGAWRWGAPTQPKHGSVAASIVFYNRQKEGLGQPLPAGAIRIYEPDSTGSPRYAGAAQVPDTPEDQRVDLTLSNAFDLSTEYRVVKSQKVANHTIRKQALVTIRNEKATAATIRIVQPFSACWKIGTESARHSNLDATTAQWSVTVPAGGKVELSYIVDLTE